MTNPLQMPAAPMDPDEAEMLARAGTAGRVATALLGSLDEARDEIERLRAQLADRGTVRAVSVTQTVGTVGPGETIIGAVIGRVERRTR